MTISSSHERMAPQVPAGSRMAARMKNPAARSSTSSGGKPLCLGRHVVEQLEQNYMAPLTLQDLSAQTGHSAYQIIRAFRRDLGTTPHAFMMQLRVERAAALLSKGESIVCAAAEAGFADQSHLTRHFKRVFGMTPGRFQRTRRRLD